MRLLKVASRVLPAIAAIYLIPANAHAIGPYSIITDVMNPHGSFDEYYVTGDFSSTFARTGAAGATHAGVNFSNVPILDAFASANHQVGGSLGVYRSEAFFDYHVTVTGPGFAPLVMQIGNPMINQVLASSANGDAVDATARVETNVRDGLNNTVAGNVYSAEAATIIGSPIISNNNFVNKTTYTISPAFDIDVRMTVTAAVASSFTGKTFQASSEVFLDPLFYIDPNFANASQFKVVVSQGVPNSTPEPASMILLGVGALAVRRRNRH